jgi:hypothetical protein
VHDVKASLFVTGKERYREVDVKLRQATSSDVSMMKKLHILRESVLGHEPLKFIVEFYGNLYCETSFSDVDWNQMLTSSLT